MTIIKFNTGREYTKNGQRIAATLQDNGNIVFADIDRGIYGIIDAGGLTLDDILSLNCFTQRVIMEDYDANRYSDISSNSAIAQQLREAAATL